MKRSALLSLFVSCVVTLGIGRASAQTTTTTSTSTNALDPNFDAKIDGETVKRGPVIYVTADKCAPDIEFEFTVTNYQQPVQVLEVWASSTANCNMGSSRAMTGTTTPACWKLEDMANGDLNQVMGKATFTTTANQIFRTGFLDDVGCPEQSNQKYTVYFVPLANPTSANPNSPPDALSGIQQLTGTFTLYTKRPNPPVGIQGHTGRNQLKVSWSPLTGVVSTTSYRAYFDTTVGDDPTCSNTLLTSRPVTGSDAGADAGADAGDAAVADAEVADAGADDSGVGDSGVDDSGVDDSGVGDAGADDAGSDDASTDDAGGADAGLTTISGHFLPPDSNGKTIFASGSTKGTSASLSDLDKKNVALNGYVAAAVVTTDIAGNESELSEIVCIQRVNTLPFLEACAQDPNCKNGFQSCSVSPPSRQKSLLAFGLLLGLGIAFWVRRRLV